MSYPVFYVPAGDVLPVMFNSYAGSTGASATLTGLAVTDIEIYKDGSVTQRASDAGYTLLDTDGIDFDGITGLRLPFGFPLNIGLDHTFAPLNISHSMARFNIVRRIVRHASP